jgi:acyl-coenzyme A thioesterase PaaI-like protein
MAADVNPFVRIAQKHADDPESKRSARLSNAIGDTIPFVRTTGCAIETYTNTHVAVRLDDRKAVHNHIGGLHAAALALLAETATGLVVALNLTPPAVPLLRRMTLDFERPARGAVRADARLSSSDAQRLSDRPVGKIDVPIQLVDSNDTEPVTGTLQWAWIPEDRL